MIIKNNDFQMLNLSYTTSEKSPRETIQLNEYLKIYKTTNFDLVKEEPSKWFFDDSAYVADLDFIKTIYDDEYFAKQTIWEAECYLQDKMKEIEIPRFTLNIKMFKNYNFIGQNTWNADKEIEILIKILGE